MKQTLSLFLAICWLLTGTTLLAGQVSGEFLTTRGNIIKTHLRIGSPAPQTLIVEERIPPGTQVLSTKPAAQKINDTQGIVKWLFKGIAPGEMVLTLKVKQPLQSKPLGILRYRDPSTGQDVAQKF